jgi:hypothetical protein
MIENGRPDPLDELRGANPVQFGPEPSGSKARIWARIQEAKTMDENNRSPRRRFAWVGGIAAAAVAGVAAAAMLLSPGDSAPAPTEDPGTGIGSCVETYSTEALANRDFAFDGTVTSVDGESVAFNLTESFVGSASPGGSVTLKAPGMSGSAVTSGGGPTLTAGERYLVAGDAEFVWACGFTQPYDEAVAAEWREATR